MIEIKAPNKVPNNKPRIFLAGSIEMGAAENWQEKFSRLMKDDDVILLNPRRDDWDSSWIQSIENQQFNEQVSWELNGLETADVVVFYFDPTTKSPITLMELGYVIGLARRIVVCCPEGFWRKGNVDIICDRNLVQMVDTVEELVLMARKYI